MEANFGIVSFKLPLGVPSWELCHFNGHCGAFLEIVLILVPLCKPSWILCHFSGHCGRHPWNCVILAVSLDAILGIVSF